MRRHLYRYTHVERPFEAVVAALHDDPAGVLQDATDRAVADGDEVVTTVHFRLGGFEVGRPVHVHVGEPGRLDRRIVKLPLRWHDAHHDALFPVMTGQLEVAELSVHPPLSQLTFVGHYRPPLGLVGVAGDALAGHRVAEEVIGRFLDETATRVTALVDRRQRAGVAS